MIPDLVVFLDVDDLEEIGDLEGYVERTSIILVFCSNGYFQSKNCMRELVCATQMAKPIIALIDPDAPRGGLSMAEIHEQLLDANADYRKWGFDEKTTPNGQALYDHLFADEPIEWDRIGHYQDVTMRLIAERLLPDVVGKTYVDREIINRKPKPMAKPAGKFHLYCSEINPGAIEFMQEVAQERHLKLLTDEDEKVAEAAQQRQRCE